MRRLFLEEHTRRDEARESDQRPCKRDDDLREVLGLGIDCEKLLLDRRLRLDLPQSIPRRSRELVRLQLPDTFLALCRQPEQRVRSEERRERAGERGTTGQRAPTERGGHG